jgi:hypothetical protein
MMGHRFTAICACIMVLLFSVPAFGEFVSVADEWVVDRSRVGVRLSMSKDYKINVTISFVGFSPEDVVRMECRDQWSPGKAASATKSIAQYVSTAPAIAPLAMLKEAGLKDCSFKRL